MKDKKKMMIVAILGVVVVGVGAFQFMGSSSPATKTDAKKPTPQATASPSGEAPKNPGVAAPLAERDPFAVPKEAQPAPTPTPAPTAAPTPPATNPGRTASGHPVRNSEHVPLEITGSLPNATPGSNPSGPIGTAPVAVQEPPFAYQVVGVMVGARPCAVFSDSQGNQRLVPLGGSLDPDTKVTGIEKGKVTLRHRNKTLQFEVGGNPNAK